MKTENGMSESLPNACLSRLTVSEEYILHSAINNILEPKLAISLSTNEILLYDIEKEVKLACFQGHQNTVTDIKFSQEDPNLLYSSSLDGTILLWDLRKEKQVKSYGDDIDAVVKPITCFDYNINEHYLCGGTEVIKEDSFLLFWDKRVSKPVGGYWDSHYDEITRVQFHASKESYLASSSVDGIINIFNLHENSEENALENTLNIHSSVNTFCWATFDTVVSCITSTEEFQFWSTSEAKPSICMAKKRMSEDFLCDVDYLINTFEVNKEIYLAAGANDGSLQLYSGSLKRLKIIKELRNGHTDVIRTASHSKSGNYFVTGGEDGVLCVWRSPL